MSKGMGRVSLALSAGFLASGLLAGCGQATPIAFHRVVSPCIDMPTIAALDGKKALTLMLKQDFANKDTDGNGELTLAEVNAGDTRPNLIDQEIFERIDKDQKGKITLAQTEGFAGTLYKWAGHYKLKLLIRFDKDGDRYLTFKELQSKDGVAYFNLDEAKFKEADGNSDDKLDPNEFLDLVLSQNADACGALVEPPPAPGSDTGASSLRRQPAPAVPYTAPQPYPYYGPQYAPAPQAPQMQRQVAPPQYRQPVPPQRTPYPPQQPVRRY